MFIKETYRKDLAKAEMFSIFFLLVKYLKQIDGGYMNLILKNWSREPLKNGSPDKKMSLCLLSREVNQKVNLIKNSAFNGPH